MERTEEGEGEGAEDIREGEQRIDEQRRGEEYEKKAGKPRPAAALFFLFHRPQADHHLPRDSISIHPHGL
jgi:hypothetical protein